MTTVLPLKTQKSARDSVLIKDVGGCSPAENNGGLFIERERELFLAHRIGTSEILPGLENLILPMLSYPGCHVMVSKKRNPLFG